MTTTKEKLNHTPTPWSVKSLSDKRHRWVAIMANWECNENQPYHPMIASALQGGGSAPYDIAVANAELIVQAVNQHAALLAVAEAASKCFEKDWKDARLELSNALANLNSIKG